MASSGEITTEQQLKASSCAEGRTARRAPHWCPASSPRQWVSPARVPAAIAQHYPDAVHAASTRSWRLQFAKSAAGCPPIVQSTQSRWCRGQAEIPDACSLLKVHVCMSVGTWPLSLRGIERTAQACRGGMRPIEFLPLIGQCQARRQASRQFFAARPWKFEKRKPINHNSDKSPSAAQHVCCCRRELAVCGGCQQS